MALSNTLSLKLALNPPLHPSPSNLHPPSLPLRFKSLTIHISTSFSSRLLKLRTVTRAVEESQEEQTESEQLNDSRAAATPSEKEEQSDLGEEIRQAMMERKKAEGSAGGGGDLWSGVAEEIREIEWPSFGKVLGTTGVVLGVIAGSSVALLTVNALLAELSDKVFAGRGVQDFFS